MRRRRRWRRQRRLNAFSTCASTVSYLQRTHMRGNKPQVVTVMFVQGGGQHAHTHTRTHTHTHTHTCGTYVLPLMNMESGGRVLLRMRWVI